MSYIVTIGIFYSSYLEHLTDTSCGTAFYLQNGEENSQDATTMKEIPR